MAELCCPSITFSHWGGMTTIQIVVEHIKKVVAAKTRQCVGCITQKTQHVYYPTLLAFYPMAKNIILLSCLLFYLLLFQPMATGVVKTQAMCNLCS